MDLPPPAQFRKTRGVKADLTVDSFSRGSLEDSERHQPLLCPPNLPCLVVQSRPGPRVEIQQERVEDALPVLAICKRLYFYGLYYSSRVVVESASRLWGLRRSILPLPEARAASGRGDPRESVTVNVPGPPSPYTQGVVRSPLPQKRCTTCTFKDCMLTMAPQYSPEKNNLLRVEGPSAPGRSARRLRDRR